jgi:hypothetical protein
MSEVYFPADRSPAEWRAMARGQHQYAADSWERSDTDGFVSQWASGVTGRMYDLLARLAEAGGVEEMKWVFDSKTGEPVEWRWIETRYGSSILIPGAAYGEGRFFNPSRARRGADRLKRDQAKGFHWGTVRTEVVAMFSGGGSGLSGALSVHPITERKKGSPLEVVEVVSSEYEIDN